MSHIETKPAATLLMGAPGTGKTTSLISYIEAGLELFVVITDPGGEEALIDQVIKSGADINKLHWKYIPAAATSWATAEAVASRVNTMSYEALGALKQGLEKQEYKQFLQVMACLRDFTCDRTGLSYGAVNEWDSTRALAIDSMTGINKMAKRLVVGAKPTIHQGEWGTAMEIEEQFLDLLVGNTKCFVCCIAHIQRTKDELRGTTHIAVDLLGTKLAPKIPHMFSDVVLAVKDESKFNWSTTHPGVDLKARTLPLANNLKPSFVQIVEGWRKRQAAIAVLEKDVVKEELTVPISTTT